MILTKQITIAIICSLWTIGAMAQSDPACEYITDNYSGQVTSDRCAPLTLDMEVEYKFDFPVDPSKVEILYIWNDGTSASDVVVPTTSDNTKFSATMSHFYPPGDDCSYTAEAFIIADGEICTSSSRQEQTFSAWSVDNKNGGELYISPPEIQICEGDPVDSLFIDQSTFNCNIGMEPDKPNRMNRWVQFIYNTDPGAGNLIPNASVVDDLGNTYPLTNASGNSITTKYGDVIAIPIPADASDIPSWRIVAPAGAVVNDFLEITLRNWNICNPYDELPLDGNLPADPVNGDNPPIERTAYVRIVTTPAVPNTADVKVCTNTPVFLVYNGNTVRWYSDAALTNLVHTGNSFNPTSAPFNLDNSVAGTYEFYVTDAIGSCESTAHSVELEVVERPTTAVAGNDQFLCVDEVTLNANTPTLGSGLWTATGGANIIDPTDPKTHVTNLDVGSNTFTWTTTNDICTSNDEVVVYRDLQPDPAMAGNDTSLCNSNNFQLNAEATTNGGLGNWSFATGSGTFIDNTQHNTFTNDLSIGLSRLVWSVTSTNGGCITTTDTIDVLRDISPSLANAGTDISICEADSAVMGALAANNNGTGTWDLIAGNGILEDINNATSKISTLLYGDNIFEWKVISKYGICNASYDTVIISRYEMVTNAIAGSNQIICQDSTLLNGNEALVGVGIWTTTSGAVIENINDPKSKVTNLDPGANLFTWTITNGPCTSMDQVTIFRDLMPDVADAGTNTSLCNTNLLELDANAPTNSGKGNWSVFSGSGNFTDINQNDTYVSDFNTGINRLVWTIESNYGACPTTNDTVDVLFDISPNSANAGTDQTFCETNNSVLSANLPNNNGTASWSVETGSATLADNNSPTSSVSNLNYGNNTLVWAIESEHSICAVSYDTINIIRYEMPNTASAGLDQELCSVLVSDSIFGNVPNIGNGLWSIITSPIGSSGTFLPNANSPHAVLSINSGYEGFYELMWEITNGTCTTTDTVSVDFGVVLPPAEAGPDTAFCGLSHILEADIPVKGSGIWSVVSGNGSPSFSNINDPKANVLVNLTEEGKYVLEWKTFSGGCTPLPIHTDSVEVYFKPTPANPIPLDTSNCGPETFTLNIAKTINATTYKWYDSLTATSHFLEDTAFTTPLLHNSRNYYLRAYNDTAQCESSKSKVGIDIHPVPEDAISGDVQNCGADSLTLNAWVGLNGSANRWYENVTGNTIYEGSTYTTPYLQNSTSYWVSSYNTATMCESDKLQVTVIIDSVPKVPSIKDTSICGEGSIDLEAITGLYGDINRWYNNQTGGTLLATSENYISGTLSSTTTFYVSSYNSATGCESARVPLTITVHNVPLNPIISDTSLCGYDSLTILAEPGTYGHTLNWFDAPGGNNLLETGNTYTTPYLATSVNYWLTSIDTITGCQSLRSPLLVEIKDLPMTTPIQGHDVVRQNQSNVIYSVDYHLNSSYQWEVPSEITKQNEVDNFAILTFPNMGQYTISVTEIAENGCPGIPQTKDIDVTNDLIELTVHDRNIETCHDQNALVNVIPVGGNAPYFFEWYGDTAYLTDVDIANPVFIASATGNFELGLHVWDLNGNHAYDTVEVKVNPNPVVELSPRDTFICAGTDYALSPKISGGSGSYPIAIWTGNTVALSSIDQHAPVFNTLTKSTYDMVLIIRDTRSCTATDSITIHNVSPEASFTSDAQPDCSPVNVGFSNSSKDATDYIWDFNDGETSEERYPSHTFYNLTTSVKYLEVNLTAIDEYKCTSTAKEFITVYPNPDHSFSVSPNESCDPVQAIVTSTPGGFQYKWDFGDGSKGDNQYSVSHEYRNTTNQPIDYDIQLISTSYFGCSDTFYNEIRVFPSPKAFFVATPETQMYPKASVIVLEVPIGDYDYSWDFGDGFTSSQMQPDSHRYELPGNYEISLKMDGPYCSDSTMRRVTIIPHPPMAKFKKIEPGCMPLNVQFENESNYADTYLWEFGDGAVSHKPDPNYTYYEAGVYKIRLTATKGELKSVHNDVSTVFVLPNSFFDVAPKIVFVNDEPVNFFNLSDHGDVYEWDFGDGNTSTDYEAQHMYESPGTYDVTLKVWTNEGCFDLYEMRSAVVVEESGQIVFPNVIKPYSNIDQNQSFRPAIIDEVADDGYHLMIFNRWGELIFETHSPDEGWNGYYQGEPVKSDVYVWLLKGKYLNGRAIDEKGDVTVIY